MLRGAAILVQLRFLEDLDQLLPQVHRELFEQVFHLLKRGIRSQFEVD
jgi:fido (protein-threonine AMPylation protein)